LPIPGAGWRPPYHRALPVHARLRRAGSGDPGPCHGRGSANIWITQIIGETEPGRQFAYVFFSSGGTGARPNKDGISATAFPSGIRGVPAEIIENASPLFRRKRELAAADVRLPGPSICP
jgi:Hydantoinase B/oxoprolinase